MKWHLVILYAGLAAAIAGVVSLGTYAVELEERQNAYLTRVLLEFEERQVALAARISGLEERQVALTTWSVNVDRNLSGLGERQAALTRWSVGVDGESQSVANDIANLRRSIALRPSTTSYAQNPQGLNAAALNAAALDELGTLILERWEEEDNWRRSVETRLQCAIPPSVIVDIVAVARGDFTKAPGLIRQAQTTTRCLS